MTEYRTDKAPEVDVETCPDGMALVTIRKLISESVDDEGRPVYEYDFHQFTDLYSEELMQGILADIDAAIAACVETERRQQARLEGTRYDTAKVLEQQNLNTMLATTELYEMLIGGM